MHVGFNWFLCFFCVCSTPEVSKMHADESIDLRVVAKTLAKIGVFCSFCYYCIECCLYKRMNSKTPNHFSQIYKSNNLEA